MDLPEEERQAARVSPRCGDTDVPHLILRIGSGGSGGSGRRSRSCGREWADRPMKRPLMAGRMASCTQERLQMC